MTDRQGAFIYDMILKIYWTNTTNMKLKLHGKRMQDNATSHKRIVTASHAFLCPKN
jgi:hypothetical protein